MKRRIVLTHRQAIFFLESLGGCSRIQQDITLDQMESYDDYEAVRVRVRDLLAKNVGVLFFQDPDNPISTLS